MPVIGPQHAPPARITSAGMAPTAADIAAAGMAATFRPALPDIILPAAQTPSAACIARAIRSATGSFFTKGRRPADIGSSRDDARRIVLAAASDRHCVRDTVKLRTRNSTAHLTAC